MSNRRTVSQFNIAEQIAVDDCLTMTIRGDCMKPVLFDGETIRVTKKRVYLPGDILVFQGAARNFTCHRFLGYALTLKGIRVMTKADNGDQCDGLVQIKDIIGKVTRSGPCFEALIIPLHYRIFAFCNWIAFTTKLFPVYVRRIYVKMSQMKLFQASIL